ARTVWAAMALRSGECTCDSLGETNTIPAGSRGISCRSGNGRPGTRVMLNSMRNATRAAYIVLIFSLKNTVSCENNHITKFFLRLLYLHQVSAYTTCARYTVAWRGLYWLSMVLFHPPRERYDRSGDLRTRTTDGDKRSAR